MTTHPNPAAGAASMTAAMERARETAAEYIRDNFGPKMANLTAKGNAFEGMIDAFHRAIVTAEARGLERAAEIADQVNREDGLANRIAAAIRAAKDQA